MALLAAADLSWKDKQVVEWSEDDARQVLTDSPWAKTVRPSMDRSARDNNQRRPGGGMGRGGGVGIGGVGIGLPGMGGGWRGGTGGPGGGGGYPSGGRRGGTNDGAGTDYNEPPALKLRWESAFPVRAAELKARDTSAPTLNADYYAIAVYGVPSRISGGGDSQSLAKQLKKQAAIKRDGKKDLKPSSVEVLQREDGPVIVYLFPRSREITRQDKRIEFDAQIGRLHLAQFFYVDDMNYQGKLEL